MKIQRNNAVVENHSWSRIAQLHQQQHLMHPAFQRH